jgi:hypothetical protein
MAKKQPNQKSQSPKSPLDRRRSRRFDNSAPMPLWLQKILQEELERLTPCDLEGVETKLPAQEPFARNLVARAMNGHMASFDEVLKHLALNSEIRQGDQRDHYLRWQIVSTSN